ncbi:hypothetical protein F4561_005402 [Lipingzhangella halophila]|uniref:Uncharacterized protein n=1 Tax=Lipingzhangella halophila TaxID=1783352 RepID=A0A7W7RMN5_9ACTN|nr:hypothetical protein [Lipingzhangella halophila]
MEFIPYRYHYCGSLHTRFSTAARCIFKKSTSSIAGEGPYAFVHGFRDRRHGYSRQVFLSDTRDGARAREAQAFNCGPRCVEHKLVVIRPLDQLEVA